MQRTRAIDLRPRNALDTNDRIRGRLLDRPIAHFLLVALVLVMSGCDRAPGLEEIRALQDAGRYSETLEPLRELIKSSPDDPEIHFRYGVALSRTGSARLAVWSLRKAAETESWKIEANLELSRAAAQSENWQEAIEAANRVIEIEPDHAVAHLLRGESYLGDAKDPDRALEDFEFVLDLNPLSVPAMISKASALLLADRPDEAKEVLDQLENEADELTIDESSRAQICGAQAVLLQERGELEPAERRFDDCLEKFPAFASVISPAVAFFDSRGQADRATTIVEKALELAPGDQSYRRLLSERMTARGDHARAKALLEEATRVDDPAMRSEAWTDLTNYHLAREELPEAIAAFEEALALSDDPPPISILSYADMLARAGRHEDALRESKKLDNDAYRGLIEARVELDRGHPEAALARLDQVFPVWPNNPGARYYAARAAEQLGDFGRAVEEYRQSIRSGPEQTEASLRLAKLYLNAGAGEFAWNAIGQYVMDHPSDPEGLRVLIRCVANDDDPNLRAIHAHFRGTAAWAAAVATRAATRAELKGPEAGLAEIAAARDVDLSKLVNAEVLRQKVLLLIAAKRSDEARQVVEAALTSHPAEASLLEIRAELLERTNAKPEDVRAAYEAALAKDPNSWLALEGLGRVHEQAGDSKRALELYDRATRAFPESPTAARRAAELVERQGSKAEAATRLLDLLKEHPWDSGAALALARLRLADGVSDDSTLELAERAVMFQGGKDAQKLLIQVHEARGESDRASEIAQALEDGRPIPPRKRLEQSPGSETLSGPSTPVTPDANSDTSSGQGTH